jgi:hypothetical protein
VDICLIAAYQQSADELDAAATACALVAVVLGSDRG